MLRSSTQSGIAAKAGRKEAVSVRAVAQPQRQVHSIVAPNDTLAIVDSKTLILQAGAASVFSSSSSGAAARRGVVAQVSVARERCRPSRGADSYRSLQATAVATPAAKPAAKTSQYELFTLTTWLLKVRPNACLHPSSRQSRQ